MKVLKLSFLCALFLLASCSIAVRNPDTKYTNDLPDDLQPFEIRARTDLTADQKASVEFATNTSDNTYFRVMEPNKMCGQWGASDRINVSKAFEYTEEAKRIRAIASLGILTLADSKRTRPPQRVIKEVPAGEELIVHAGIYSRETNVTWECGPLYVKLRPEAGKKYRLGMESERGMCRLRVTELSQSGAVSEPQHATWRCTASLTGLDGNNVTLYKDHPAR